MHTYYKKKKKTKSETYSIFIIIYSLDYELRHTQILEQKYSRRFYASYISVTTDSFPSGETKYFYKNKK